MAECGLCGDMAISNMEICPACGLTLCEQCGEPVNELEMCSMGSCGECH